MAELLGSACAGYEEMKYGKNTTVFYNTTMPATAAAQTIKTLSNYIPFSFIILYYFYGGNVENAKY